MAGEDDSQNRKELSLPTTVGDAYNLVMIVLTFFGTRLSVMRSVLKKKLKLKKGNGGERKMASSSFIM